MYMYVYFNEWRSNRVLVRLGLDNLIGWLQLYMYVCMYMQMFYSAVSTLRIELAGRETRFDNFGGNSVPGADLLIRSGCSNNSNTLDAVGMNCWHACKNKKMYTIIRVRL